MSVLQTMLGQYGDYAFTLADRFERESAERLVQEMEAACQRGDVIAFGMKTGNVQVAAAQLHEALLALAKDGWLRALPRASAAELCAFLRSGLLRFRIVVVPSVPELSEGLEYVSAESLAADWNMAHPDEQHLR